MLSKIDEQQIDHLYVLLRKAEKEDQDTAAALRWAILQLEQQNRHQTGDLVFRLAFTPEPEINSIMDTGAFNEIVKGYTVLAMQTTGATYDSIQTAVDALDEIFDDTDAEAARKAYRGI